MSIPRMANDSLHWYMGELTSRIVAQSGIPTDRHHVGKMILQSLKDDPDFVVQIDGATNQTETARSVLQRTVCCANSFRKIGLGRGDVIMILAPNYIDIAIPVYAALYLGIIVAPKDCTSTTQELRDSFAICEPKVIFCQKEKATDVQEGLNNLKSDSKIIIFDKGYIDTDNFCSFDEFLEKYGCDTTVEDFKPEDFDPEETVAFLEATSGTSGNPKVAAVTHKNMAVSTPYLWNRSNKFPGPTRLALVGSSLQWSTAIINFVLSPILRYTRLQTSQALTQKHVYHLINTYKPTFTIMSPILMTTLVKSDDRDQCDFTSFESIMLGGNAVPQDLIEEFKAISPCTEVLNSYGISELSGLVFHGDNPTPGSCGKPLGCFQYRIVNMDTQEDINEPNVPGELWIKGPGVFKEYYKNKTATEEAFAEDRWFKTGDIFYRDKNWNFFFVERIKLFIYYKNYQISPVELETVIRQHPEVLDVTVVGVLDDYFRELPVACVVPRPGFKPTAEEIKNLVKDTLSGEKQLSGGVIFLDAIPQTASTKVHRRKLIEMVKNMPRE